MHSRPMSPVKVMNPLQWKVTEHAPKRAVYRMPIRDLKAQIARLPEQPGVYVYYNDAGDALYVGKARALRDRVRSYLGAHGTSPRIDALLDEAQRLEVIVTDSVMEALALENHLIKQRMPRYNILLRDDKNYPYLQLTTGGAISAGARGPARPARRTLLCRTVPAGLARPADDGVDAPVVRHPVVQRGHHRRTRAPVPRVRHQTVHRAVRPRDLLARGVPRRRRAHAVVSRGQERRAGRDAPRSHAGGRGRRAIRTGRAAARRDSHD